MTDRNGMPRVVCPCWRHRLTWWALRQGVDVALHGRKRQARFWVRLVDMIHGLERKRR